MSWLCFSQSAWGRENFANFSDPFRKPGLHPAFRIKPRTGQMCPVLVSMAARLVADLEENVTQVHSPLGLPNMPLWGARSFASYYDTWGKNAPWNKTQLNGWGQDHNIPSFPRISFLKSSNGSPAWQQCLYVHLSFYIMSEKYKYNFPPSLKKSMTQDLYS